MTRWGARIASGGELARRARQRRAVEPTRQRRGTYRTSIGNTPGIQHQRMSRARRHILCSVRRQHPRKLRSPSALEPVKRTTAILLIESVQKLIEQQQLRLARERTSEQREPPLAIRQRKKPSSR